MKLAIFDFCETLANFQTADAFVEYAEKSYYGKNVPIRNVLIKIVCRSRVFNVIDKLFGSSINKEVVLKRIKGLEYDVIDRLAHDYYKSIVRPNLINETIEKLEEYVQDGVRAVLISGGYDIYLRYFAKEYGIQFEDVYSTRIQFRNNILTGYFEGKDCVGLEKVKILNAHYQTFQTCSIAFSDSASDKPMLMWANTQVLVLRNDRKPWGNFKNIIIWKKN